MFAVVKNKRVQVIPFSSGGGTKPPDVYVQVATEIPEPFSCELSSPLEVELVHCDG